MDHLAPFHRSINGNKYLIIAIDYLTKWIGVQAIVSTLERNILYRHGTPDRIISDQGSAFTAHGFANFMESCRVKHVLASAEHPLTNGLVERINRTLTVAISAFVNFEQDYWEKQVPTAAFCINTAKQATTEVTPFELVYGRTAVLQRENVFPGQPIEKKACWPKFASGGKQRVN